jgi:hypothetical protein
MIRVGNYVIVLAGEYQSNNPKQVIKILDGNRAMLLGIDCPINVNLLIAVKNTQDEDDCL